MIRCLAYIEQAEAFMRAAKFLTVLSILLLFFVFAASAQKSRRSVPRPAPRPTPTPISPVVAVAKLQVSNQLYNVNIFVDKMGPIAVAIENADKEATAGRLKKEALETNKTNKEKLVAAIRGLRDGLVALETDFRTRPQLTRYLSTIQGISTLSAQSEDRAIAGQFVASKDPLRQIALKLNDTLAVLPGPAIPGASTTPVQNRTVPASTTNQNAAVPGPNPGKSTAVSTSTTPVSSPKREPSLGMTTAEVLLTSWGNPIDKRSSGSPNGRTEVWVYSGNRALYFYNGILTNIKQ